MSHRNFFMGQKLFDRNRGVTRTILVMQHSHVLMVGLTGISNALKNFLEINVKQINKDTWTVKKYFRNAAKKKIKEKLTYLKQ